MSKSKSLTIIGITLAVLIVPYFKLAGRICSAQEFELFADMDDDLFDYKDYSKYRKELKENKEKEKTNKKRIYKKYKKYVEKMREPGVVFGLGYQDEVSAQVRGKFELQLGKKKINRLWTAMLLSRKIEIGFDYVIRQEEQIPTKYYLFIGGGLGIDMGNNFDDYVHVGVGLGYYFTRNVGIGLKFRKRLDELSDFGISNFGLFLNWRM